MDDKSLIVYRPIGIFRCDKHHPAEAASQGHLDQSDEKGLIELYDGQNFEQAVRGLGTMTHLWVLFHFHQKENWKPLVQVPRGSQDKQGVFGTRSPHRPNPIGLSLVRIEEVDQRKIWVSEFDLLNETPILDLKPFHPEADMPTGDFRAGWMDHLNDDEYHIQTTPLFEKQATFLHSRGVRQLPTFCKQQLRFDPFNAKKKRVKKTSPTTSMIAYRTWRIHFSYEGQNIRLEFIQSGYSDADFKEPEDRWQDRQLHIEFIRAFGR